MESSAATIERTAPRDIAAKPKAYAFERSLGLPPAEACRRAGGKVENGHATKWERMPRVQAWITYYRSLGQTDEMLAAKRARVEQRLELAAYGNIFDFAALVDPRRGVQIDWDAVASSPYGVVVSGFKFDKDTGVLVDFERDNALQALAQLRDMHGFKAPAKTELSGDVVVSSVIRAPSVSKDTAAWQQEHAPPSASGR